MKTAVCKTPDTHAPVARNRRATRARTCLSLAALAALMLTLAPAALAQRRFTREYPTHSNIRVQLLNRSGKIEVVARDNNSVRVTATVEASPAKMSPWDACHPETVDAAHSDRQVAADIKF